MARIQMLVESMYTPELEKHIQVIVDALEYVRDRTWDQIDCLPPGDMVRRGLERKACAIEEALECARKVEG